MSIGYTNYQTMKEECPQAARCWRAGDRLYYLGLLSGVVSVPALVYLRTITLAFIILGSALAFVLGIILKNVAYAIARQSGCTFD
jgi:hypothetical protein